MNFPLFYEFMFHEFFLYIMNFPSFHLVRLRLNFPLIIARIEKHTIVKIMIERERKRERERETDRETERQRERERETETERQRERERDRDRETERDLGEPSHT